MEAKYIALLHNEKAMFVFSNPVINGVVGLQINTMPAQNLQLRLLNEAGQTVLIKQLAYDGTASSYFIECANLATGLYQLQVIDANQNSTNFKVVIAEK
jgi:hypothetical protein